VTFNQTALRPYMICRSRIRIWIKFSESIHSVHEPESRFANLVLKWFY